jgi:FO synthase
MSKFTKALERSRSGTPLTSEDVFALLDGDDLPAMMAVAAERRDNAHGSVVSYSRKVFIPLTQLCRDSCHYCTFAHPPRDGRLAYLSADEVLAIARTGAEAGCREALFTLGDKPELRYRVARDELKALGHDTTISYLAVMAALVLEQTGLLPHLNAGVVTAAEIAALRRVSVSQGLMLETAAARLSSRGGPHFGSPDKEPSVRLAVIRAAGETAVPFTSGILIGIGETRRERLEALLRLRELHEAYGHIQEIIIQNFRAKAGTRMANHPEPALDEHSWTIAAARLMFGPEMNVQAPPNLSGGRCANSLLPASTTGAGCHLSLLIMSIRNARGRISTRSRAKPRRLRKSWSNGSRFIRLTRASLTRGSTKRCERPSCALRTAQALLARILGLREGSTNLPSRHRSP